MRADLPTAVRPAIARANGPTLIFDRARIAANLSALATAARAASITTLFAAKSFPHAEIHALVADRLDGFDVASAAEVAAAPTDLVLSIADPTGHGVAAADRHRGRLIVGCETVAQVAAAPPHAEIAIRLSASLTGRDPAIGAVLDGSGHRRSRFGLDVDPDRRRAGVRAMVEAAAGRPIGLHVHHGPVTATTGERFVATARAALAVAEEAGVAPRFLDLGGAWHAVDDLARAFAEVRAAVPAGLELIVEPGRVVVRDAGFACGRVLVARTLDDRELRVVALSRSCHLRWSQLELVGDAPHPGTGRATTIVGPTCYEDDVLGDWVIGPTALAVGDPLTVRHVTGYAVAWNTGFGGVPAADVILV